MNLLEESGGRGRGVELLEFAATFFVSKRSRKLTLLLNKKRQHIIDARNRVHKHDLRFDLRILLVKDF